MTDGTVHAIGVDADGRVRTGNVLTDARVERAIARTVEARFQSEVISWALENDRRLPTRLGIREDVRAEFLALMEALGSWAYVDSTEIFPQRRHDERPEA